MKKVYLTKGLPGSGKSTWAKNYIKEHPDTVRVNKDDLRAMLNNSKHTQTNEKQVLRIRDFIVMDSIEHSRDVIVDDTNLSPVHQNHLEQLIKGKAELIVMPFLHVPLEQCIKNDLNRPFSVGEQVIRRMWREWMKLDQKPLDPIVFNESLPYCVIFDIDGTLAHIGDRSPYDAKKCVVDKPNKSIIILNNIIENSFDLHGMNIDIILLSGRKEEAREETEEWLHKHGVKFNFLYMRKTDDNRKDSFVKEDIFNEQIRDKYNVLFIVDDRQQVVDMWRDLGVTCLQCNWGGF